jgi:hypothetical protein
MAVGSVEKVVGSQRHYASWCVMRECGLFNWFRAAMRLYNSSTNSNSYTMKKVLHADMQLSTRSLVAGQPIFFLPWMVSAMDGLTQSYTFKQKLQNCEPIDLSRFVVDLRERHLMYWTPHSETRQKEHNSKRSTYH